MPVKVQPSPRFGQYTVVVGCITLKSSLITLSTLFALKIMLVNGVW
jgi:hypothetical protein